MCMYMCMDECVCACTCVRMHDYKKKNFVLRYVCTMFSDVEVNLCGMYRILPAVCNFIVESSVFILAVGIP